MDKRQGPVRWVKVWELLSAYKYVLLVAAVGLLLLLWPEPSTGEDAAEPALSREEDFSVEALEERLSEVLSRMEGAGSVSVILTVKSGMERVLAQDVERSENQAASETVRIGTGSGKEEVVLLTQKYPEFQGALIVCEGGDDPQVRLQITQAVAALTGLGTARISVCKGV